MKGKKNNLYNLNATNCFQQVANKNKIIDEIGYAKFVTEILQLHQQSLLQFYFMTHLMNANKSNSITSEEFDNLFKNVGVKTVKDLRKTIPKLQAQLKKDKVFQEMYERLYTIMLNDNKVLDFEYAQMLWPVLLKDKLVFIKQLGPYLNSLGNNKPNKIYPDLWRMMLEFSLEVKNLKEYDQNGAWPIFIDKFVEFIRQ